MAEYCRKRNTNRGSKPNMVSEGQMNKESANEELAREMDRNTQKQR